MAIHSREIRRRHYFEGGGWQWVSLFRRNKKKSLRILYPMKTSLFSKSMSVPEILVLVVFVLYLIFPVSTPSSMNPYIESPLGVIVLFCIIVSLFLYSHPVVAVVYLFVAYTLLRRSAVVYPKTVYVQYTDETEIKMQKTQQEINNATPPQNKPVNIRTNGPKTMSLEEEIVAEKSPIGVSEKIMIIETSYLPVSTNVTGTSPA